MTDNADKDSEWVQISQTRPLLNALDQCVVCSCVAFVDKSKVSTNLDIYPTSRHVTNVCTSEFTRIDL